MANKKYIYTIGRRKSSTAIIKFYSNWTGKFNIFKWENTYSLEDYYGWHHYLIEDSLYPFYVLDKKMMEKFDVNIVVRWWWMRWQAEAIRLWLSRALIEYNPEYRSQLKSAGLLKRDPRQKERKKPWLKKARKSPQWSKR